MCRGEQTQALGFYLEAKKQSPLERREGESWGQKGVGAVVLPKHALAEKWLGVGDSPAPAKTHHPLCAVGLSRRQKVV